MTSGLRGMDFLLPRFIAAPWPFRWKAQFIGLSKILSPTGKSR